MAFSYACLILQRLVVPLVLVLAALFRPVGISFVYLLMFFISPFIPVATAQNFKGPVTAYLIILIALSTILLLCHIALQVAIITLDIGGAFHQCSFTEQLLRHIGFINFFKLKALAIIEWLLPEIVVFITSIAIYLVIKRISFEDVAVQLENGEGANVDDSSAITDGSVATRAKKEVRRNVKINFEPVVKIAPMFCLATIFFAAILRPSVPGGFYFLFFLLSGSYWATFQSLQRGFAILIRFLMVVLVLHIISVVSYQTPWVQQNLDNNTLTARLVGLEPLIKSSCAKDIRIIFYETWFKLDSFLCPISLLFSYYVLSLTSKNLIQIKSVSKPLSAFGQLENGTKISRQLSLNTRTTNTSKKDSWSKTQRLNISIQQNERSAEPTETTPLVRHKKIVRGVDRIESSVEPQGTESGVNDIPMNLLNNGIDADKGPSLFDQICYGIVSVGGFIYQNSYIFTNILMMAWSIVYHSWLTFVFLLWANVLWMIPNQRKAMMRSSPFIVIYAELLLIAQYIYGMNLTNDELPTSVNTTGINLQQIGLERPSENNIQPCIPLIVKTSFLLMFWVTLRQFFKEKHERRRHSTIADMVAPLQVTVSTATADLGTPQDNKKTSKFLKKAGDIIKNLLVRLWIWLLILVIFLCAITGVKMTGFRICYMAMFLFFLLVFQSSSRAWVKVMYGFWLFLIFYAMSILTLIYTYQFDKFDQYWNDYLNISKTLQEDIGLKKYETKDLFLHLVSPTIIVILTVIQVHYFHKRFIAALQQQSAEIPHYTERTASPLPIDANISGRDSTSKIKNLDSIGTSIKDLIRRFAFEFKSRARNIATNFKGVCWRFLELHLIKAVYISAFVCCVSEVCVLHITFCALCIIGLISKTKLKICISRIISLVVSVIILTKMIYQVQYISHERYNVVCNATGKVENNALWFGLQKATVNGGLMDLIKKYIMFMVMVTLHAVVTLRQRQMRTLQGEPNKRPPKVLFPGVNRADAEKNLEGMIKYLFNYGFYKFGKECTLIALVSLITYRQDVVAVFYVFWLCAFVWLKRSIIAKFWSIFQCFTATVIFLEYLLLVGLPSGMCLEYPWNETIHSAALQKWAMLPGPLNYSHVNKLIFEFIILIFINRQKKVFNVEYQYDHMNDGVYPGGTNKSVLKDIEDLGHVEFENPTRDFLSTIRNYLDVIKNAILCGFYWITLAIVFLAGINISDLLAIGYLVGSFIFLWQGSDFYLRPIRTIRRRWNILIMYNVINITLKTVMQIGGCLFLDTFQAHACWLIHMLGIVCADGGNNIALDTDDTTNECPPLKSQSVLIWDAVCFAFLIFQMRIFKSHYFCHIINDTKANTMLAYRGAEIIEDLRQKQIEHRNQHEQEVLRKIKRKMEKIRATQQKMLRPIDKPTHYDEHGFPLPGPRVQKRKELKYHPQAIRAGDYYMFDDMDEKFELDLIEDEVDFLEEQGKIDESERKMTRRKNLFEVCKEISSDRKKSFSRQRSYASAPGSRIGIKSVEPDIPRASVISDPLVYPDSCTGDDHEKSEKPKQEKSAEIPSTSKDVSHDEQSETKKRTETDSADATDKESSDDEDPPNPILRLLEAFMVSVVIRLNRFSRNYRYVMKILAEEKKTLKESKAFDRYGSMGTVNVNVTTPIVNLNQKKQLSDDEASNTNALNSQSDTEIHDTNTTTTTAALHQPLVDINEIQVDTTDALPRKYSLASLPKNTGRRSSGVPGIRVMPPSVELGLDETGTLSDEWSYEKVDRAGDFTYEEDFASRDHHMVVEALISAWYAILSNTDLICYIVVFINQVINASIISLPLPLMVFLWGTLSLPRPTKTFWITLIAYTQALVLIKCVFQFRLIWSNYINLPNQPLAAAKIIGIEMNNNYANYDLLLLLVLFFHRFVLKSQGLWKSEYKGELMQKRALVLKENASNKTDSDDNAIVNDENAMILSKTDGANDHSTHDSNSVQDSREYIAGISKLTKIKYVSSFRKFFLDLVHKTRLPADVYALMFLCDFVNFFVLLFGFTAFGSQHGDGGVQTYLAENKVPIPFLIMLLIQFILIVIDRALYLRKALVNKIIFHLFSVIGIHIWMFFVIPAVTERSFYSLSPPIIFYIIKCFYLLFSSYQIKCGYPKRILGNFLTKGFSLVNMISFKVYMQVPFLFELRTILDWVCTDTTMTLFDWLKMEDIFSEIYFIKCGRQMETDFPAVRAEKKAMLTKIALGGLIILLIVVSIWGPLCLYALGNAVGQSNIPYEVSASIRIGSYDPIYQTDNRESIYPFDSQKFSQFQNAYKKNRPAITFLSNYDEPDVAAIILKGNSPSLWAISPPDKERLLDDLLQNRTLICRFAYSFTRTPPTKGAMGTVSDEITYALDETFSGREAMIAMLQGNASTNNNVVVIPLILPKFIKVYNSGELNPTTQLMPENEEYRPLVIKLHGSEDSSERVWWEIKESCNDTFSKNILSQLPYSKCDSGVVMYTFNDKKFPSTFSFLTAGGIIGLYTTFVLLASRLLKSFIAGQSRRIMYEDLPYVDRVLQLCLDIYLVREALEFALEEDLFAKLLFLYRSPETMIKWTRPKEETNDDETDTESVRSRNSHRRME